MATPSEFPSVATRSEENIASEAQRCDSHLCSRGCWIYCTLSLWCKYVKYYMTLKAYELFSFFTIFPFSWDLMIKILNITMNVCTKNPGHKNFHKVADFEKSDMPKGFQEDQLKDFIKVCADLTCFLRVEQFKGAMGSGYITSYKDQRQTNNFCTFRVCTARHVINSEDQVKGTKLHVFYDGTAEDEKIMEGLKLVSTNENTDFSKLEVITHDKHLADKLIKLICRRKNLLEKIMKRTWPSEGAIFVISHPHGTCKKVTIGKLLHSKKLYDNEWKYLYSAHTCPGSSGGQVIGIGGQSACDRSVWFAQHTAGIEHIGGTGYFWSSPFFDFEASATQAPPAQILPCGRCGRVCLSRIGLVSHQRACYRRLPLPQSSRVEAKP